MKRDLRRSVRLSLKKTDELGKDLEASLDLDFSPRKLARAAKQIRKYLNEGWEVVTATGDPQISDWINDEVARFEKDRDKYRASVRGTVKLATSIVVPKGKISVKKVVKAVTVGQIRTRAEKIRDKFRKRKKALKDQQQNDDGAEESVSAGSHP